MKIWLARTDTAWLQRVDTRRAKPMPARANPVAYMNAVTAEFEAGRRNFLPSVAQQFGLDPAAITVVERDMDGWIDDAPYQALVASLASGTFEGRPVILAPLPPAEPDPDADLDAALVSAMTLAELKTGLRAYLKAKRR